MPKARYKGTDGRQVYEHESKTIAVLEDGVKVIEKINNKDSKNNPQAAEPGDRVYIIMNGNEIKQIRYFNQLTSQPIKDIDCDHSHDEIKGVHVQEFVDGKRVREARRLTAEENLELQKLNTSIKNLDLYKNKK